MGPDGGAGVLSILILMSIYNDLISFLGPLIGGGVALSAGLDIFKKTGELKEKGINAEGIVFRMEGGESPFGFTTDDDQFSTDNASYPAIRFLTADQVWITGKPSSPVHNLYKEGQTVKVVYNKENPAEFIIASKLNAITALVLQVTGGILILAGIIIFIVKI